MTELKLTANNFSKEITDSDLPAIVEFWSGGSGPCRMISSAMFTIAAERNDVKVCKINYDEEKSLVSLFNIKRLPTCISFKDGKEFKRRDGYMGKKEILALIDD